MKSIGKNRIPELDGIRAIAIWMVLWLHVFTGYREPANSFSLLPRLLRPIVSHGWMGVDLFFLLSGFLITGILLDTKDSSGYFKNFYIRRILRIMPLYFAVVIIWSFLYRGYGSYFLLSSVFGANLAPLLHVPAPQAAKVLWSLAVEEHFYLLWPAAVYWLDRRKLLLLCTGLLVACPLVRAISAARGMDASVIHVLSWCRFDGLTAGAVMALWARSPRFDRATVHLIAIALLTVLGASAVVEAYFLPPGPKTIASIAVRYTQAYLFLGALFILAIVYRGATWTAPLRMQSIQFSGALSYCLYLVHYSLGDLYDSFFLRSHALRLGFAGTILMRGAFLIATSFAIAACSRKFLEEPFLALKDRFTSRVRKTSDETELSSPMGIPA